MMRIITGRARGVKLDTLEGDATRPTSERVKGAIFSSLQFELGERRVLDLFAGSGQMGLEALSRGAVSCTFADASPEAMAVIKENAKRTGFFGDCRFLISDYRNVIRKAAGRDEYDLIFIDPPYAMEAAGDAVLRILEAGLAARGALIVTEAGRPDSLPELPAGLVLRKAARYSVSYVTIYEWRGEGEGTDAGEL